MIIPDSKKPFRHPSSRHEGTGEIPLRLAFEKVGRRIMTFDDGIPLYVHDVKGRMRHTYPDLCVAISQWAIIYDDGSIHLDNSKQIDEDNEQRTQLEKLRIKAFAFQHRQNLALGGAGWKRTQTAVNAFLEWERKSTILETIDLEREATRK